MNWLTIVQNISTFVTGPFATALIGVAVCIAGGEAMVHQHWGRFWSVLGGGAVLISSAWMVTTFM